MMQVAESVSSSSFFEPSSKKFHRSSSQLISTKREGKKRKGVHFEKFPSDENTSSTSDYLFQEGKQWRHIASYFNCDQERNEPEKSAMSELLDLCNWYDQKEKNPDLERSDEEDSDDDIPFAAFSLKFEKPHQPTSSSSSNDPNRQCVSSLRLASKLRLDSKPILVAQRKLKNAKVKKGDLEISEDKDLELAFRGIMSSRGSMEFLCQVESKTLFDKPKKKVEKDDFWEDVEF